MKREYIAFISYRHLPLDSMVADKVHEMIERYRVPRDQRKNGEKYLGIAFRDLEELPLTSDLTADIYTALDNAQFLVVICTPDTPKSLWVTREIEYFISKHGRDRVLTVLAAGTGEESIPKVITTEYSDDGVTVLRETEPLAALIAADTQQEMMKKLKSEFVRLAAAMLGCPYDELVQRQKKYHMQQLSAALGMVAMVAGAFIVMLLGKNAEISAQLYQAQVNESRALAMSSVYELQAGDRMEALAYALEALPTGDADRPYVAQAEKALVEALQVYGQPTLRTERTVYLQNGIWDILGTTDGNRVFVESTGSTITCVDARSGEILWEIMIPYEYSDGIRFMELTQNETVLLVHGWELVWAVDVESGAVLRQAVYADNVLTGDLLLSEQLLNVGGWYDPVTCTVGSGPVPENCAMIDAEAVWDLPDGRMCALTSDWMVITCDEENGKAVEVADISGYVNRWVEGTWDDVWFEVQYDGTILLIGCSQADKTIIVYELSLGGTVEREHVIHTGGSFTDVFDVQAVGDYLAVATGRAFVLIDLTDDSFRWSYIRNEAYEFGLDEAGNVLVLFEDRTTWYIPAHIAHTSSTLQYLIDAESGVEETNSYVIAGSRLYYEERYSMTNLHLCQVTGVEYAADFTDPIIPDPEKNSWAELTLPDGSAAAFELCLNDDGTGCAICSNGVYLYDGQLGKKLNITVPDKWFSGSVLVKNGEVLVLKDQFICTAWDLASETVLGKFTVDDCLHYVVVQEDAAGKYLYAYDAQAMGTGVRVDMDTWEVVAELPDMRVYIPETDQVLIGNNSGWVWQYEVYDTQELITMGNALRNGES